MSETKEEYIERLVRWMDAVRVRALEGHPHYPANFPVHSPNGFLITLDLSWHAQMEEIEAASEGGWS